MVVSRCLSSCRSSIDQQNEQSVGEEPPLGFILCAGKNDETIRLLDLEKGDIRVAAYWTKLLPRAALAKKLHQAVRLARMTLDRAKARSHFLIQRVSLSIVTL